MDNGTRDFELIIIGAGIAGASAGFHLAPRRRIVLLERESQPGYHSTGRSAAIYTQTHGPRIIRALTVASKEFLYTPPTGFADHPLVTPRGLMLIGREDQTSTLDLAAAEGSRLVRDVRRLDGDEARRRVPILRKEYVAGAVLEPGAMDLDVHAIHYGFLRSIRAHGGEIVTGAEAKSLNLSGGRWEVETPVGRFAAPVIVNAAGAWCDKVAALAGASPIGLVPKRRTIIVFDPPPLDGVSGWPVVSDVDEQFYFKPDAGKILASPCDETPMEPHDVHPDDADIALAVDRVTSAADLKVAHIRNRWAGLRSFVADGCPVAGFDPQIQGFFWLAGQGGYGIETSSGMGQVAAALALGEGIPGEIADLGVSEKALSPERFAR